MIQTPPALRRLVADLATHPQVDRVWLFGSRARGEARERSDIDLAIEAPGADRREWLELCRIVEEADTLLPIDVVRLEEAPELLRQQVRTEGKILYER
ncbi:MAG TPA: nucleotidyltransferase domain-containing protein [Candidatus Acidoferrales bacterium]|nr:nucleotidyltransferase domain-containing protein [Candidatus Acidoferrales bacterium]